MRTTILILLLLASMVFTGGADRSRRSVADRAKAKVAPELMIFAEPPTADFTATGSVNGRAPQTIDFTSTSTNGPTSWSWDFGDGQTSTEQNPTHIFNTGTACNVSLTVSNDAGSDSESKTAFVDLLNPYWKCVTYTVGMSSGKMRAKNFIMSPVSGGTVWVRYLNWANQQQIGADVSSSANPPAPNGVTVSEGTEVDIYYWVSSAPTGYDGWGSSGVPVWLISGYEMSDNTGDTSGLVPLSQPE